MFIYNEWKEKKDIIINAFIIIELSLLLLLLNFLSNHPFKQKIAIIKNLVDTAILLSHVKFHEENLEIIKNLLVLNNFPIKLINKHINNRIFQIKNLCWTNWKNAIFQM